MPPKKKKLKKVENEKNETDIIKEELSNVEKKMYEAKFVAIEKIITRLKAKSITCKKNIDKNNIKTENINIKFSNEYEHAKLRVQEKNTLKKKLNEEIEFIKKELKFMEEICKIELKAMDEEFLKEVKRIKSITAVHVGRNNKLEEFSKQETMLEEKYTSMVEKIGIMVENYEKEVKMYKEKEYNYKIFYEQEMIRKCDHFAEMLKKLTLLDDDVLFSWNAKKICDINITLQTSEELRVYFQQKLSECILMEKNTINKNKSIRKHNDNILCDFQQKKKIVEDLKIELSKVLADVSDLQQNVNQFDQLQESRDSRAPFEAISELQMMNQTLDQDLETSQIQIKEINNCIMLMDRKITKMENCLLRIYNEVLDHAENVKKGDIEENTEENIEENISTFEFMEFIINKLYDVIHDPNNNNYQTDESLIDNFL